MIMWSNRKHVFYNPFYDELYIVPNRRAMMAEHYGLVYIGDFDEND